MEKDIGKIKKNDITDIVVRIDDFGGKPGLTIREFTTSEKYTGFTKSGTRISQESFKAFRDIINSIDEKEFLGMVATEKPAAKQISPKTTVAAPADDELSAEKPVEKKSSKKKPKAEDMPKEELF